MLTDAEIIQFSRTIPGYYDIDELVRLLILTNSLRSDSTIVEIGVEYGRSTSIFLQSPYSHRYLWLIDSRTHNGKEGIASTHDLIEQFDPTLTRTRICLADSAWAKHLFEDQSIDLLHVDGDHEPAGIWADMENYLPKLKIGGIMVAHDYKRSGADPSTGSVFPGVDKAIDAFTSGPDWEDLGVVNTQVARRRLA